MSIKMTDELVVARDKFLNEPTFDNYNEFRDVFIKVNGMSTWKTCVEFLCTLGADVYNFCIEEFKTK